MTPPDDTKERGGSKIYYDREKHTKAIKDLRHRKTRTLFERETKMLIDKEIIELLEKLNKTEESKHDSIFKKYMEELLQKTK